MLKHERHSCKRKEFKVYDRRSRIFFIKQHLLDVHLLVRGVVLGAGDTKMAIGWSLPLVHGTEPLQPCNFLNDNNTRSIFYLNTCVCVCVCVLPCSPNLLEFPG